MDGLCWRAARSALLSLWWHVAWLFTLRRACGARAQRLGTGRGCRSRACISPVIPPTQFCLYTCGAFSSCEFSPCTGLWATPAARVERVLAAGRGCVSCWHAILHGLGRRILSVFVAALRWPMPRCCGWAWLGAFRQRSADVPMCLRVCANARGGRGTRASCTSLSARCGAMAARSMDRGPESRALLRGVRCAPSPGRRAGRNSVGARQLSARA